MKTIHSFRARGTRDDPYPRWKIIFSVAAELPLDAIFEDMAQDVGRHLTPAALVIIVRGNVFKSIFSQISAAKSQVHEWRIDPDEVPLMLVSFDASGELADCKSVGNRTLKIDRGTLENLFQQGLRDLFQQRGALIRAKGAQHFVHPGGKHSVAFVRAANILIHGHETMFAAACLLRPIPAKTRHLWIDTSSIASLAYAFAMLRNLISPDLPIPAITSFSSWAGVNDKTNFPDIDDRAVLISATTSGTLARHLIEKWKFERSEVVTLFSFEKDADLPVICNFSQDKEVNEPPVDSGYTEGKCDYCNAHSRPVRFVGDQFLADAISYIPTDIFQTDAPETLAGFMEAYYGMGAFGLSAPQESLSFTSIDLDPSKLFQIARFADKFNAAVARTVPCQVAAIFHLEDDASKTLANKITQEIGAGTVRARPAEEIRSLKDGKESGSGVVIVAGSIDFGHELDGISRDLRDPFGESPRTYLVGFSRRDHTSRAKQMRGNLVFNSKENEGRGLKHVVQVIEPLILPEVTKQSAWVIERRLLELMWEKERGREKPNDKIVKLLDNRIDRLRPSSAIVFDDLFWPGPDGKKLALRDTFAFWTPSEPGRKVSQGDVLFTIASVLENMRVGKSPRLVSDSFTQKVIDPGMFGRFNDGVIQAALLRCAMPHELFYAGKPELSAHMTHIIERIFDAPAPANEASMEFLLALACGRLRLSVEDTSKVAGVAKKLPAYAEPFRRRLIEVSAHELAMLRA